MIDRGTAAVLLVGAAVLLSGGVHLLVYPRSRAASYAGLAMFAVGISTVCGVAMFLAAQP